MKAAKELGISISDLWCKIKKYDIRHCEKVKINILN
ncbi:helix-turn-helix domain-containing protein [Clostridium frigoris]